MENLVYVLENQKYDLDGNALFILEHGVWVVNPFYNRGGSKNES